MPARRLLVRKIREVLRLKHEHGLSHRAIARACAVGVATVTLYLQRTVQEGLGWPLPAELDDAALEARLFRREAPVHDRVRPDCAYIHRELKRDGVTLQLLWEEYAQVYPNGYRRTQFCEIYRQWARRLRPSMRQVHRAGEKTFIDFSGKRPALVDPRTGEVRRVELFVTVLGASSLTYAEATATQQLPDWVDAHVRMVEYFDGTTALWVPDQLRSAITRLCRYEPGVNRTYEDLAAHYGAVVVPARPRKPKDKAAAEAAVLLAQRWIRAVSGRPGRGPRNGRVWDGDVRARSRRWFNAGVPDDEIPGLQRGLRRNPGRGRARKPPSVRNRRPRRAGLSGADGASATAGAAVRGASKSNGGQAFPAADDGRGRGRDLVPAAALQARRERHDAVRRRAEFVSARKAGGCARGPPAGPGTAGTGTQRRVGRTTVTGLGGGRCSAMRRRPRAGGGGAEPVPLEGGLGERPGLAAAVVGRLVEPGVERVRPSACPTAKPAAARPTAFSTVLRPHASRDDLQAEALGRTACRARRAASRHRRSRHGAERRVGGHWSRLRGQS